ncbi:hypothetical protein [Christiangramia sediminis]|uniref:Uncharacterized protein n=1 Tax=Christiangramia sediminis TaxID=2881336 RepID=A0A9X1LJE2_9FLAO|nr:hypothetical protein [Christiangramia sediminis]MCB7481480.1 hypothetical protein [Christiangramia sediminis]
MKLKLILLSIFLCFCTDLSSQKKLNRPSGIVGIKSIDSIVAQSFDLYDLLFDYETRIKEGELLCPEDICEVEKIFLNSENIIQEAIAAKVHFKKKNVITRTQATIHLEKAKRAVYYSRTASEKILLAQNVNYE